jgi:hypothetical protein
MVGLVVTLALLVTAQSSFAQVSLALTANPPSAGEIQTNKNAQTAEAGVTGGGILVTGSLIATSPLTLTRLRITYPSPITSSPARCYTSNSSTEFACPDLGSNGLGVPSNDPIRIEGQTGVFSTVTQPILNTAQSRIEVWLPASASNAASGSFRIVGVRIDANGKTGAQSATAALSDAAANYLLTTNSVQVINAISNGIGTMSIGSRSGQPNLGSASVFTNRTVPDKFASITISEGFASAFRTASQLSNSATAIDNSTRIRLTFNNLPSGVTLTLSMNVPASTGANALNATFVGTGTAIQTVTSTSPTAVVNFTATSLSTTETLEVDVADLTLTSTAAVTTTGSISVTATFFPIGDALDAAVSAPTDNNGYPVFTQLDVGPVTVVNIVAANTTLLIPLAEKIGAFDTGISIANTTADPYGGLTGGGAVASAGALTFNFFPSSATGAGTSCTLTTSSTNRPGFGISSDGTIAAGATYTVLLSQLLPVSNCAAGDFVGYIFITADFLNAHGMATISDFRTYSLAANVLVLAPPATTPRNAPTGGVETLSF